MVPAAFRVLTIKKRRTMKTKNIFKTVALAMLMPAMLLTTACSNQDDVANINNEPTVKKGYALPVTVNVTRQGDEPATRASYNESTRKLEFSAGDKLFVQGSYNEGAYIFAAGGNKYCGQYQGLEDILCFHCLLLFLLVRYPPLSMFHPLSQEYFGK